ncbi:MAG TPA: hypothetical protein VKV15_21800 [Bryobacteraceae bacterium]|nr:hypothetical protein [Bryobacteraceae bacterium]
MTRRTTFKPGFTWRIAGAGLLLLTLCMGAAKAQKPGGPPIPDWFKAQYPNLVTNRHFQQALLSYQKQVGNGSPSSVPQGALIQAQQAALAHPFDPAILAPPANGLAAAIQGNHWTNLGPAPETGGQIGQTNGTRSMSGRIAAIAVDPTNSSHWYIGAAGGGVWSTSNAGSTWTALTDAQVSLSMGALAIPSGNHSIVYAGTGEGNNGGDNFAGQGLLKSIDGGSTWTVLGTSVFANTSFNGLLTSSDGSTLIAATNPGFSGILAFGSFPNAPPTGIYRSTDGGNTWSLRVTGDGSALAVDPTNFANQYAALGNQFGAAGVNGLYRSADSGNTWTHVAGPWGTGASVGRIAVAIAPSDRNTMYVAVQNASTGTAFGGLLGLWKTSNAFAVTPTFTQISAAATDDGSGTHGFCGWDPAFSSPGNQCWYGLVMAVDPANSASLYAGGIALWKFNGTTWTEVSKTVADPNHGIHVDQHALVFTGTTLLAGNDGGIWSSADGGTTWSDNNTNLSTLQPYYGSVNPGTGGFMVTNGMQDNASALTTSMSAGPWASLWFGDGGGTAISNTQKFALSSQNQTIVRTTDGGTTVLLANQGIPTASQMNFEGNLVKCPSNDDILLTGSDRPFKVTNFFSTGIIGTAPNQQVNTNWADNTGPVGVQTNGNNIRAIAFAPSDTTCRTYAFGDNDGFGLLTQDGGTNWNRIDFSLPCRPLSAMAFDPANPNTLYVTVQSYNAVIPTGCSNIPGHIFKSTNALSASPTFTNISPPVDVPFDSIVVDPGGPIYAGSDFGLWVSTNAGTTWSQMGPATGMPNVPVYDLKIGNGSLVAFTHGRGAFLFTQSGASTVTVTNVSSSTANGVYGVGAAISIQVTFSGVVNVTGTPQLALNSNGAATYTSGSGTTTLTFTYTVAAGQSSTHLDYSSTTALTLNGGTINDTSANPASLVLAAPGSAGSLSANSNIVISTVANGPTVTNVTSSTANGTYGTGALISVQVSFSAAVNVTGSPQLALNSGGSAIFASGSGTSTLTFSYTVAAGQSSAHLDEASAGALTLNGGTINAAVGGAAATLLVAVPGAAGSLGASTAIIIATSTGGGDTIVFASSAAALSANDTVAWTSLGADATSVPNTFSGSSTGGRQVQGAFASSTGLVSIVCGTIPSATACSWGPASGGFQTGDTLVWALNPTANAGSGALTITVPQGSGVGAVIQADSPGQFTAKLELFNGSTSLGSTTQTSNANGDAFFLGALDTTAAHVTKAVFSLTAVSAGGDPADFAIDKLSMNVTTVTLTPNLTVSATHAGSFTQGQTGAILTITVGNNGQASTSGTVTVADTVPVGLTATAISGTGWTCGAPATGSCSRTDPLAAAGSYPAITVTVNVAANAAAQVTNMVSASGGGSAVANGSDSIAINQSPPTAITIQTNPTGLQFSVDGGTPQIAPQTLNLTQTSHIIAVVSPQAGVTGTQSVFTSWSDNGALSHTITVGASPATFTANFKTQFQLTTAASPSAEGTVTPPSGFFDANSSVTVIATANTGFNFINWTGPVATPNSASTSVTMSAPQSVTANFSAGTSVTIQTNPAGLQFSVDGGTLLTAPQTLELSQGSHTVALGATQTLPGGAVYTFLSWADGVSTAGRTINVTSTAATFTATFTPQAPVTIFTNPTGLQFTVDSGAPQTAPAVLTLPPGPHTIAVTLLETPSAGTQDIFTSWSDGGAISHSITVGTTPGTYTANFKPQFQLTTAASPANGGSVAPQTGGFFDSGTVVNLTATAASGFQFSSWSGPVSNSNAASTTVTMSSPQTVTANFSAAAGVTIQTNPPGLQFTVDGGPALIAPQVLNLSQGTHILALAQTQAGAAGTQYVFTNWSDNGAASHTITVGSAALTFTATFKTQFQLTITSSPPAGGTVTPQPGFFDANAVVPISATASSGFSFSKWTGNVANTSSPSTTVTMSAPQTVAAVFTSAAGVAIQTNPTGLQFTVDGGAPLTAPQILNLPQGVHTISVVAIQAGGTGTQFVFTGWSDGGAASHTITVTSAPATFTATFKTQFQLTLAAVPSAGGTFTPQSGQFFDANTAVPISATANSGFVFSNWTGNVASASAAATTVTMSAPEAVVANFTVGSGTSGLRFVPVTPCRVLDTRQAVGPFGGPQIAAQATRNVAIPQSPCNIPGSALAYSLNVTVVPPGPLSYVSIWPAGQTQPVVSTLNSFDGRIVANAAIVPAGTQGAISVFASDATNLIIDINGYFAPAATSNSLSFYSVTPCRIADTRNAPAPLGGPFMSSQSTRSFPIANSACAQLSTAQAYSLNITVVPRGKLGFLTTWPTGVAQPVVSTLNSSDGSIVANAAIVPAGAAGGVSIFVTDDTDVIIDINGYFAPPGAPGAQSLYTITPCRVADTRGGFPTPFGSPTLPANGSRSFPIPTGVCTGIPATAQAYSLNFTVVPTRPLGYLTAWPSGVSQPVVSTLNSPAGKVVANAAIVPAGTGGAVSVFVTDPTDVIMDINAYFAP